MEEPFELNDLNDFEVDEGLKAPASGMSIETIEEAQKYYEDYVGKYVAKIENDGVVEETNETGEDGKGIPKKRAKSDGDDDDDDTSSAWIMVVFVVAINIRPGFAGIGSSPTLLLMCPKTIKFWGIVLGHYNLVPQNDKVLDHYNSVVCWVTIGKASIFLSLAASLARKRDKLRVIRLGKWVELAGKVQSISPSPGHTIFGLVMFGDFVRRSIAAKASSYRWKRKKDIWIKILWVVAIVERWEGKHDDSEEKDHRSKHRSSKSSRIREDKDHRRREKERDAAKYRDRDRERKGGSWIKIRRGKDDVMKPEKEILRVRNTSICKGKGIGYGTCMVHILHILLNKGPIDAHTYLAIGIALYDSHIFEKKMNKLLMLPQHTARMIDEFCFRDLAGRWTCLKIKKDILMRLGLRGNSGCKWTFHCTSDKITSSDYYTHEEMVQFKKPKKKKSLRKKEKIDLDALEAEAVSAGLGVGDLGSRNDGRRKAIKEEQERLEAEMRSNAYQAAYAKADEASKALRLQQTRAVETEEDDDTPVFGDDDDLHKSLERARKLALKKQGEVAASGPQAIALLTASTGSHSTADDQNATSGETQENKVVFTEMEEFVWGLQLDEEAHKPDGEDVFMEEDIAPKALDQETNDEDGGWTEVKDTDKEEHAADDDKEEILPDETIHETAVGKGLSGALKLLKDRGTLKETVEWGGRNMDKKKSKLVGIYENDGQKEIRIERLDEFGRILTPKEAFRLLSHKFHGKGPGKTKQEKRIREYHEELKVKQMKNSDTPSESVERMREAQARLKTPYLVLSGNVKPGQTSDPSSGFATVEKDLPGGLTPMLGDRKVEHFLGIKRKGHAGARLCVFPMAAVSGWVALGSNSVFSLEHAHLLPVSG
ncbi:hypothetical protein RHSIM_Rhsim01G0112900 [Rhododendron simsii]|uniref:SART-1 family protein DOT2 n=1 Tax=Rhododendron simsii TaxID=118357 RepID=A0A834HDI0_RHOSS|nr:hypothetical protein RHSIM_Rhsim01G0112900 [Rhododendron simsii]